MLSSHFALCPLFTSLAPFSCTPCVPPPHQHTKSRPIGRLFSFPYPSRILPRPVVPLNHPAIAPPLSPVILSAAKNPSPLYPPRISCRGELRSPAGRPYYTSSNFRLRRVTFLCSKKSPKKLLSAGLLIHSGYSHGGIPSWATPAGGGLDCSGIDSAYHLTAKPRDNPVQALCLQLHSSRAVPSYSVNVRFVRKNVGDDALIAPPLFVRKKKMKIKPTHSPKFIWKNMVNSP